MTSNKKVEDAKLDHAFQVFRQFVDEFKNESDRAAVILGVAKIDLLLYQLLERFFVPCTSQADDLLDGDSPLGTFSSRIKVAYRLGLIDAPFCKALHLIRRIRNSFAHELSGISLNTGAHRDRIRELTLPIIDTPMFKWFFTFFDEDPSPRNLFSCVIALVCVRLEGRAEMCPSFSWDPWLLIAEITPTESHDAKGERPSKTGPAPSSK